MAIRIPLVIHPEGYQEEVVAADQLSLPGGAVAGGAIDLSNHPLLNISAANANGHALVFGQTGAMLSGLALGGQRLTAIAAATADGDALMFGQASAELAGLAMRGGRITAVGAATTAGDALTFGQAGVSLAGLALTADLALGGNKISGLAAPTAASDAVNKSYVDGAIQGLEIKAPVVAMATAQTALTGTTTIDGVAVAAGERVLLTGQTNANENGIWVVNAGAWTRPADFAAGSHAATNFVFVESGTANADTGYVVTSPPTADVVDTNPLTWVQFSSAGVVGAGTNLTKVGNNINLTLDPARAITNGANGIGLNLAGNEALAIANNALTLNVGTSLTNAAAGLDIKLDSTSLVNGAAGVKVNYGGSLELAAGVLEARVDGAAGLQRGPNGVSIKLGTGITFDPTGALNVTDATLDPAGGLTRDGAGLAIKPGSGINLAGDTVNVVAATGGGLSSGPGGIGLTVDTTQNALEIGATGLRVRTLNGAALDGQGGIKVGTNYGLAIATSQNGGIKAPENQDGVRIERGPGIDIYADGSYEGALTLMLGIKHTYTVDPMAPPGTYADAQAPFSGLQLNDPATQTPGASWVEGLAINTGNGTVINATTNKLDAVAAPTSGVTVGANGIALVTDATTLGIGNGTNANALTVKGLRPLFSIDSVATNATVTAASLNTMTAGVDSDASGLHTHTNLGRSLRAPYAAGESITLGDAVAFTGTADHVGRSMATTGTGRDHVVGVAEAAGAAGANVNVVSAGPARGVISGGVAGTPYYVQPGGGIAATVPGAGSRILQVGFAMNATDLFVRISDFGRKAGASSLASPR